ncbi:phage late control D family protein [Serratia fonticola]|nr:phage late control D family protein [Serratia fonticola]
MSITDTAEKIYDEFTTMACVAPALSVTIDNKDITTTLTKRLMSLTLTDNRGFEADMLNITLDDADGKIALPRRGAVLSVAIGWKGQALTPKGTFTVDEIEHSGAPDQMTITARGADFRSTMNLQREQSWHAIKLADLAKAIADRNKLKLSINPSFSTTTIDHSDQTNESDGSYLTRLGKQYGFTPTVKNGTLLLLSPGSNTTASGKQIPTLTITRAVGDSHTFSITDRDAYTGVVAHYLNTRAAKQENVKVKRKTKKKKVKPGDNPETDKKEGDYLVGDDENTLTLRHTYASKGNAVRAAKSAWERIQRGVAEFSITLAVGRAEICPEYPVKVSGFKKEIDDAEWTITQVTHTVTDSGFTTALQLEVGLEGVDMETQ